MKTFIHEMGVIDRTGKTHPVYFKQGLNIVTGKSSTGKSALIEIFDYCFGSGEYTVPKGVITDSASIYYVYMNINDQNMVIGRLPDGEKKGFFRREDGYYPEKIINEYFSSSYFIPLDEFKKHLRSFFLDIDDVDDSIYAREKRGKKASTPSIRSFVSFMLQHQNLVANKHALFYRFDEKQKRDQAIDHTKIFLGLVDQKFFHLYQEQERLTSELNRINREQETNKKIVENQKQKIEPVVRQLYASMGFKEDPLPIEDILRHPQDAKEKLDEVIRPERVDTKSDAMTERYQSLQKKIASKTARLRKLQRQANSTKKHIEEEEKFVENSERYQQQENVQLAKSICPFCHAEHEHLQHSAEHLKKAMARLFSNLKQAKPMRAMFESSLLEVERNIEELSNELSIVEGQVKEIEKSEKELAKKKNISESIFMTKARLYMLLESLELTNDAALGKRFKEVNGLLAKINKQLKEYDYRNGLKKADRVVNAYMADIGNNFEFEDSYKPINLHFSFETFDLYHQTKNDEKIFLRSMGSGANWLYCHITLFLALHKYFAELGDQCAIPSVLFLDQPTQVYFPSFRFDKSETFDKESIKKLENRDENSPRIDDDMKAVENLFSQLSIYCTLNADELGFSPQIIVTDHADNLKLSDGVNFETLVNGNRWRTRGLIDPVNFGDEGVTK